ncbi:MAG TPA: hypothetical protein PKY28_03200 [Ferruginibacter sp.]|nr:hypothetical protein [Chitinophagaceae bacterium]HQW92073.1 hypothetical protein [Ferruginibacter sp.]
MRLKLDIFLSNFLHKKMMKIVFLLFSFVLIHPSATLRRNLPTGRQAKNQGRNDYSPFLPYSFTHL